MSGGREGCGHQSLGVGSVRLCQGEFCQKRVGFGFHRSKAVFDRGFTAKDATIFTVHHITDLDVKAHAVALGVVACTLPTSGAVSDRDAIPDPQQNAKPSQRQRGRLRFMTDSSNISAQLGAAIHQNSALNATSLLERLFQGLVYPQIWEDPVVDMKALALQPGEHVFCIASGGCNAMSYLVAQPGTVTAVDLSQAEFFASFGQANRPENIAIYDRVLVARLDSKTRAYWEGRALGRRRISMFARGFHKFGLLGRFLAVVHDRFMVGTAGLRPAFGRAEP
jgi:hypothetical protein